MILRKDIQRRSYLEMIKILNNILSIPILVNNLPVILSMLERVGIVEKTQGKVVMSTPNLEFMLTLLCLTSLRCIPPRSKFSIFLVSIPQNSVNSNQLDWPLNEGTSALLEK